MWFPDIHRRYWAAPVGSPPPIMLATTDDAASAAELAAAVAAALALSTGGVVLGVGDELEALSLVGEASALEGLAAGLEEGASERMVNTPGTSGGDGPSVGTEGGEVSRIAREVDEGTFPNVAWANPPLIDEAASAVGAVAGDASAEEVIEGGGADDGAGAGVVGAAGALNAGALNAGALNAGAVKTGGVGAGALNAGGEAVGIPGAAGAVGVLKEGGVGAAGIPALTDDTTSLAATGALMAGASEDDEGAGESLDALEGVGTAGAAGAVGVKTSGAVGAAAKTELREEMAWSVGPGADEEGASAVLVGASVLEAGIEGAMAVTCAMAAMTDDMTSAAVMGAAGALIEGAAMAGALIEGAFAVDAGEAAAELELGAAGRGRDGGEVSRTAREVDGGTAP